jgi:hypothetical protein
MVTMLFCRILALAFKPASQSAALASPWSAIIPATMAWKSAPPAAQPQRSFQLVSDNYIRDAGMSCLARLVVL